jgi:predicted nucleotidyltransferase
MLDNLSKEQVRQCIDALKTVLEEHLLGVYLYGSAIVGGLQRYSDIDLFVISSRSTTLIDKTKLATELLKISGIYLKGPKRSLEVTIVKKSEVNPWRYPPHFDFQYGDWLRKEFESGNNEPWPTKEMPDLALIITQVLMASKTLLGPSPNQLLGCVPYYDSIRASVSALSSLIVELDSDTRNVLLTLARIWCTVKTDTIRSKPDAAAWVIQHLPRAYKPVMRRARAICIGQENESWADIERLIKPCADMMIINIKKQISLLNSDSNRVIKIIT